MSEQLSETEREALRSHIATQWTDDPAVAVTISRAVTPAVEAILTARLADRNARLAAVEARTEAAFAGIRCALVHWQPEGVSKAVSCANCQSWAASIAMPFFRETSGQDPRTHGLNHAPLLNGALLDPGFCPGCDEERTLRAALNPDPSEGDADA